MCYMKYSNYSGQIILFCCTYSYLQDFTANRARARARARARVIQRNILSTCNDKL